MQYCRDCGFWFGLCACGIAECLCDKDEVLEMIKSSPVRSDYWAEVKTKNLDQAVADMMVSSAAILPIENEVQYPCPSCDGTLNWVIYLGSLWKCDKCKNWFLSNRKDEEDENQIGEATEVSISQVLQIEQM